MQGENNLKMVQISFSSSTFERITEECGILNNIMKRSVNITEYYNIISIGQKSQVCGPASGHRRNHGAPHWLLFYKFRRNFIFRYQDFARVNETEENNKIMKIKYNISFIQVLCWGSEGESEIRGESIVICLLLKLILGLTRYDNNVCQQFIEQNLNRWNKTTTFIYLHLLRSFSTY